MSVYLVRHAKAGSRAKWDGDDALRPLSGRGRAQADYIADWLAPEIESQISSSAGQMPRLVSSPFVRCVQTLEPLAERLGVKVEHDDRLAEGAWFDATLALLDVLPDGSACCSHGDVVPELIGALERRGMRIDGEPDWRKAATWRIERDHDGTFVSGHAVPPEV